MLSLGKRLRDKDQDIRKQAFIKLTKCNVTVEHFLGKEQRMLIIKEGLTDASEEVRGACIEFLRQSMMTEEQEVIADLSYLYKIIDCNQMFIREYFLQLPLVLMRYVFHIVGENDIKVAHFIE